MIKIEGWHDKCTEPERCGACWVNCGQSVESMIREDKLEAGNEGGKAK